MGETLWNMEQYHVKEKQVFFPSDFRWSFNLARFYIKCHPHCGSGWNIHLPIIGRKKTSSPSLLEFYINAMIRKGSPLKEVHCWGTEAQAAVKKIAQVVCFLVDEIYTCTSGYGKT